MSAHSPLPAKLTRPKLYESVARPRLFAMLDNAARRPVVWVCAPPGAGKTAMVASYLEARGLPYLWYQVDAGDADPATFVHYLRLAALQLAPRGAVLPLFPVEPQRDLGRFARVFLRDLFGVLPRPCAVVLDNFHEAQPTLEDRAALAAGLNEIPDGSTMIVISRGEPPPELARMLASRRIARIQPSALRCTAEEADRILAGPALDRALLRNIVQQCDGWVAALVLLREHLTQGGASIDVSLAVGRDAVFRYFTGEILLRLGPHDRRILALTAIPPSITPEEAVELTGNAAAPRLLEHFYRRHLFIDRLRVSQTTYQYHALFREFLREEMRREWAGDEQRRALAHAAALIARRGMAAEALELYREAGAWEAMAGVIREHALDWARQGRAAMLSDWVEQLPARLRESDPWLDYWRGRAWIFLKPALGRPVMERTFDVFRARGDLRGQALAVAAVVTSHYYEWADFRPLDRWLPEFDRLLGEGRAAPLDRESELRARAAQLITLLFRRPDERVLMASAHQLDALIDGEPDTNVRLMAASAVLNTYNWIAAVDAANALVARIEPAIAGEEASPLMQVWWRTHLSLWHQLAGRYARAARVIEDARAIAERHGLETPLFEIDNLQAGALLDQDEIDKACALVATMEARLTPAHRLQWAYLHALRSRLALRQRRWGPAAQEAERAVALGSETGLPTLQMPHFLLGLAQARAAIGDRPGSARAMREAIAIVGPADRAQFVRQREWMQIDDDIDAGRTARAARRLASAFAAEREREPGVWLHGQPDLAARLADFALEHRIDPEFVRLLIARNGLTPPPGAGPAWPFRLHVRVLGRFELARDGQPVQFAGKVQQRPLDVLKYVVAAGGEQVDSQPLIDALWPDAEGDAAKASFDAALFRLRKLLGVDHAIRLMGGKLSLDPTLVWTDVHAFDAAVDRAESAGRGSPPDVAAAASRLIAAYRGALLSDERTPWPASPREALRARYTRTLQRLGERLEHAGHWRSAAELYRRGLEAEPLCEPFCRGLMRSLAQLGDQAEALNAYRRCRELLSIVLGVKPADDTERLHRQIAAGHHPAAPG